MGTVIKDIGSNVDINMSLTSAIITADATSAALALAAYNNAAFMFQIGISGDTLAAGLYLECGLLECDTVGGTYTAVADADVQNPITATSGVTGNVALINDPAEDDVIVLGEYTGTKGFIKAFINVVGTHTNGTSVGIIGLRYNKNVAPV